MPALPYKPEPGSLTERLLQLLARNPEDVYRTGDLAAKFTVNSIAIQNALAVPRAKTIVSYTHDDDGARVWQATPALMTLLRGENITVPHATPADDAPLGAHAPKAGRGGTGRSGPRTRTPLPDPASVVIKENVPLPPPTRGDLGKRTSVYAGIWARMKPGSVAELPERQAKSLISYARKQKANFAVRKLQGDVIGVWRLA